MNKIEKIDSAYYRVKLPQILTDSTHGEMAYFELVTTRITDSDGIQGLGYTYAVNHGGASIYAMIDRDLSGHLAGQDPSRIEALWEKMWWALHYVGRGGIAVFAISAIDIALWDLAGQADRQVDDCGTDTRRQEDADALLGKLSLDRVYHCPALVSVGSTDFVKMIINFIVGEKIEKHELSKITGVQIGGLFGDLGNRLNGRRSGADNRHPLAGKIHRVEKQGRESALLRQIGDDAAREGEQTPLAATASQLISIKVPESPNVCHGYFPNADQPSALLMWTCEAFISPPASVERVSLRSPV